jgi:hypothetical protein
MLEQAAEGIIAVNDKRKVIFVNVAASEALRMDPRSVVGSSIDAILRPVLVENGGEIATPLSDPLPLVSEEGLWAVPAAAEGDMRSSTAPSSHLLYYTGVMIPSNEGKDVFMISVLPSPDLPSISSAAAAAYRSSSLLAKSADREAEDEKRYMSRENDSPHMHHSGSVGDKEGESRARAFSSILRVPYHPAAGSSPKLTPKLTPKLSRNSPASLSLNTENLAAASAAASAQEIQALGSVIGPDDPFSLDPRIIVTVDAGNLVIVANPPACCFFSLRSPSDLTGESIGELFASGEPPFSTAELQGIISGRTDSLKERETVVVARDGKTPVTVSATVAVLPYLSVKVAGIIFSHKKRQP